MVDRSPLVDQLVALVHSLSLQMLDVFPSAELVLLKSGAVMGFVLRVLSICVCILIRALSLIFLEFYKFLFH